jgi:hypothetical protein
LLQPLCFTPSGAPAWHGIWSRWSQAGYKRRGDWSIDHEILGGWDMKWTRILVTLVLAAWTVFGFDSSGSARSQTTSGGVSQGLRFDSEIDDVTSRLGVVFEADDNDRLIIPDIRLGSRQVLAFRFARRC